MTPQNMPQTLNSLLPSLTIRLLGVTMDKQWWALKVLRISSTKMSVIPQNMPKLQIPYYHPLNESLLGVTNDKQGQTMTDI